MTPEQLKALKPGDSWEYAFIHEESQCPTYDVMRITVEENTHDTIRYDERGLYGTSACLFTVKHVDAQKVREASPQYLIDAVHDVQARRALHRSIARIDMKDFTKDELLRIFELLCQIEQSHVDLKV